MACLLFGSSARADGLSSAEMGRLERGETIVRTQTLERGDRHYVGGVTYTVVDQPAKDLAGLLGDIHLWQRILPRTRSARVVRGARDGVDELVELTNGTALVQATYTMELRREASGIRFWVDPARRHDIEDAWGFVKAEPMAHGRTLVTYGVLIDIGPGIVRSLFEDRVRALALSVPDRLRSFALERNAAGASASR
ncbi:MAG TPA: hypothetical protein VHV30_16230 [Polyangiaceae bacterium]|jgi:hypothetical protein|nr:hypothetical protein [Polyangiaceae bacterium]